MDALDLLRQTWPQPWWLITLAVAVSFAAGAVRGFSGFGYSALVVASLAPFAVATAVVLAVLLLEMLASATVVRAVAKEVDAGWCRSVLLGNLVFVPVGLLAVVWLRPDAVRVIVCALTLLGSTAMRVTVRRQLTTTPLLKATGGCVSGLLNGFSASGGVVAALLMAAAGVQPRVLRATMLTVLLWISIYALACGVLLVTFGTSELKVIHVAGWAMLLAPTMALGIRVGSRAFHRAGTKRQATLVLDILIVTAAASLAASILRWGV